MVLRQQQGSSQRREAVPLTRKSVAQRHSDQAEMWLDRTEFEELIRPLNRTVEALRSDLKTRSNLKTTVAPVPATVGASGLAGSQIHTPARIEVPRRLSLATISPGSTVVQERRLAPRRFTRLAAAGILALAGGAASVPLMTSHSGSITTVERLAPVAPVAPVAAIPTTGIGDSPHTENISPAPVAAPNTPAEGTAPSAAAPVRIHQTVRSTITNRPRPPTTMMTSPPPQTPEIPAEAYAAWSRMAELSGNDQARTHFRRDVAPHR